MIQQAAQHLKDHILIKESWFLSCNDIIINCINKKFQKAWIHQWEETKISWALTSQVLQKQHYLDCCSLDVVTT
jgi:hypothetical protein